MRENRIVIAIIVIVFIIGFIFVIGFKTKSNNLTNPKSQFDGKVREFNIIAKQFSFEPPVIGVNKGDKVVLNINSVDVTHSFTLVEFGINERLEPGKKIKIEFIADKIGEFSFFCNIYCGVKHKDMIGKLIVRQ